MTYQEEKESMILTALEVLHKKGYKCVLRNKQNGHIQVESERGVIYNFYPTTGTIAGYDVNGIDALLQILEVG